MKKQITTRQRAELARRKAMGVALIQKPLRFIGAKTNTKGKGRAQGRNGGGSMKTAINWTAAGLIALLLSCSYLLDGPSDMDAQQAELVSLQDAIKTEAADARFTRAAAAICGENAGYRQIDATTVQCYTHKGKPTRRVNL